MIKQTTIDQLYFKMDIIEVVQHFLPSLKKKQAKCPFHDEKSASFRVDPEKQIFKCFGCGEGGTAITFIMKHEKQTFVEAVTWLCDWYKIPIETDQVAEQEAQEKKDQRHEQSSVIAWAQKKYEDLLFSQPTDADPIIYMNSRGYSLERMRAWSLGFASSDQKFLTSPLINLGKFEPSLNCGLIYSEGGRSWDFFRNRIIIPIHDHNGRLVGLAGRMLPSGSPEQDKKTAKYLNLSESLVYNKAKIWYGLHQAKKAIKDRGFAYVTEGYMDVQAMHDADMCNTVASCGTEIDDGQIKMLKRYTEEVVICYDGDAAGHKKATKHINRFLSQDFKVRLVEFPEGMDPDEYIKQLKAAEAEAKNLKAPAHADQL